MRWALSGFGVAMVMSLSPAYAGDCSTSFDQSCLATRYNKSQVERELESKEARAAAEVKAQEEKAEEEEERVIEERRHRERLQASRDSSAERERRYKEQIEAIEEKREESDGNFFRERRPSYSPSPFMLKR